MRSRGFLAGFQLVISSGDAENESAEALCKSSECPDYAASDPLRDRRRPTRATAPPPSSVRPAMPAITWAVLEPVSASGPEGSAAGSAGG